VLALSEIEALVEGRHADPFSILGPHRDALGNTRIRVWMPGATSIGIADASSGKPIALSQRLHAAGLFEATLAKLPPDFDYRLTVAWPNNDYSVMADAFSFGSQISSDDLKLLTQGNHPQPYTVLGAHIDKQRGVQGVRFALWAPNAKRVSVVGDFNQWDGRRHPMRLRHEAGVWEMFIPHVKVGDHYKYELIDRHGQLLPLKADPYAFATQLRPDTASRVGLLPEIQSLSKERARANVRDSAISIYEVHAASWQRHSNGEFLNWKQLAKQLPSYVAQLGFTHIELMPVSEYPFDGSWGYQNLGLYALSARFGDPQDFAIFLEACHERGLGVILDWVPAHFPTDAHGMAQFDGTALYEYADPREGYHNDWNTLIYNYSRNEVRNFLIGNARYWIERYGVDGLRVDAVASMLYRDYSRKTGEWIPNVHGGRENLEAISFLQRMNEDLGLNTPGAMTAAEESTAFAGVSAPTSTGGLGFHYKWNMGWMNDTLQYIHEDPVHRRWHHDKMSFGLVYAFSENFILPISHDEVVHGKGSMLGKMPGDEWQRFANLRAYYGFMWGHPGKKLLFMGQEFAQPDEWNHDKTLPWHLLGDSKHAGIQHLVRDLNLLYRAEPALHKFDCEARGFEWLIHDDRDQSVFAWLRKDESSRAILVVCNFTPVPRMNYRIGLPAHIKQVRELLNTDSRFYGGGDVGNGCDQLTIESIAAQGHAHSVSLHVPPLATVFFAVD
jgi:1,4-alpha-glucan branching enzyme